MNNFIWEKQNALTSEFCQNVIYKFERDLRKGSGKTLGGFNPNMKKSTDICVTNTKNWEKEDKIFYESLFDSLHEYRKYIENNFPINPLFGDLNDSGYQIQRTIGGDGYYNWHHDFHWNDIDGIRMATFIWYLNTIDGPGGETEFVDGTKITPEEGKIIFFPATWNFVHRGIMPPKGTVKYLCTGWLHIKSWN